ncbi:MAG: DUF2268 domain-containing putative Zn-dependent protease [Deinococcota bacterium]
MTTATTTTTMTTTATPTEANTLHTLDTLSAQRNALESASLTIFEDQVMTPLEPLWQPFASHLSMETGQDAPSPALNAARMMGIYSPLDNCEEGLDALDAFAEADVWTHSVNAAEEALRRLEPHTHGLNLNQITLTLALGNLSRLDMNYGAYTGMQTPTEQGHVALVMGYPNPTGTPRLPVAAAHELHHIVRFAFEPFMPGLTLGKYLVAEGLAEAFGLEVANDPQLVGPYCTALSATQMTNLKPRFAEAIHEADFNVVRGYIFGDWAAEQFHYPKQNVPDFAGYSIGFALVQAYLARTGQTATQATYVPWQEIVEASGYFG